ncbi:MAG: response regulator [Pseudochelatococcus sp.]|jgi:DNA-binding response OmpR family regulator|uniref:response regulator n=1 Tax=Pseudochelatococcus sp. TaxID=2020869 RepID=UPI003D8E0941
MEPRIHIFVVDDEPGVRAMIEDYLTLQGYAVSMAENGEALDRLMAGKRPDLILLDVNMPGEDGFSIVKRLRGAAERMGVIMLTANADETSRIAGLSNGADDYLAKPFELRELLARVRAILRRVPPQGGLPAVRPTLSLGPFRLDPEARRLLDAEGVEIEISIKEYELLETFARHPRQILSRDRLCELSHGRRLGDADRSVDIRIARLRKKIEPDPASPTVLRTVRGEGYLYEPTTENAR